MSRDVRKILDFLTQLTFIYFSTLKITGFAVVFRCWAFEVRSIFRVHIYADNTVATFQCK